MLYRLTTWLLTVLTLASLNNAVFGQSAGESVLTVQQTTDFAIDGRGTAKNWSSATWIPITPIATPGEPKQGLNTRMKALYSSTGLYILFQCEDSLLTASMEEDFATLWKEDVVEVFLWPNEQNPVYFEYELSPLNYELLLLISNEGENYTSWRPFSYNKKIQTRHMTAAEGGPKSSGAAIRAWTAEFFIPYTLLHPLSNVPPDSGTRWRANFYRIDYDREQTLMSWQPVKKSFHEYKKFGTLLFE
ncbi:carbohydrate-binding family 9-like protein [Fodinibius sediminis]|uniref:Carbohydrate family 9 binding domain-like n=1 Tax=Fodinibius sediminis TaxID=1214077 RepID=A0A521E0X9_9BACT|nr:carbohydrate-binding family 9-like protein [Fodinibius sediminis]SMO77542.1 Carbohydrate family 9 binding domain-like [Fodinibius sediminis]